MGPLHAFALSDQTVWSLDFGFSVLTVLNLGFWIWGWLVHTCQLTKRAWFATAPFRNRASGMGQILALEILKSPKTNLLKQFFQSESFK